MKNRALMALVLGLGVLAGFQNCAKGLPDNLNQASSAKATSLGLKYFLGEAMQTADLSTVGGAWTAVQGASVTFELSQPMTLDLRANGSVTSVAGTTYSSGHCGLRFVVDGTPYGDPSWGDVIVGVNASSATTGWWTPWTMERHLDVAVGSHTVILQQTGWNGTDSGCKSTTQLFSAARLNIEAH